MNEVDVSRAYEIAKERYNEIGVDVEKALARLKTIAVSVNCWQGDDVGGFDGDQALSGGIMATGNYPGRARNADELRGDLDFALGLIPGTHRVNLHAMYLESDTRVDRDQVEPKHFNGWIDWAAERNLGLDFNPTFFSHPKAADGFTLAHPDDAIRSFWVEHGKRSRDVAREIGRRLGKPSVNNFWIPDGWKDHPADRLGYRERLAGALDAVFADKGDAKLWLDAVESKLFGIGSETFVVGSHEFYLAYAISRGMMLCMDAGHYHPTESIAEKVSALLPFVPNLLLHVSRPVRWDSDHVVLFDDETRAIAREIARADAWSKVFIALDFFDASINRIAAWVIGTRSTLESILFALLEPTDRVRAAERENRLAERLAWQEQAKLMPFSAVWDEYCRRENVPLGADWIANVADYEKRVLLARDA